MFCIRPLPRYDMALCAHLPLFIKERKGLSDLRYIGDVNSCLITLKNIPSLFAGVYFSSTSILNKVPPDAPLTWRGNFQWV